MGRFTFLIGLFLTATAIQEINGSDVLFIGAVGSKSHKNFYMAIIEELLKSGHQVTLVTPYSSKGTRDGFNEIVTPEGNVAKMDINFFELSFTPAPSKFVQYFETCEKTLADKKVQDLLQKKFDVILLSSFCCDCYFSLIYQLQVPFIYVTPMGLLSNMAVAIGNPLYPAFLRVPIFDMKYPLSFLQRIQNTLFETAALPFLQYTTSRVEDSCRKNGLCPESMPPFAELQMNVSMIFLNSVRELESPTRPYVPGVVHAGAINCQPAKPLPQSLQEWVDGAGEDGFIFFSLGSVVKSTDLPEKHRKMLIKVFSSLKQRVLWKWDADSMPDLPANVKLMKWLPQQDILGHPKLRLFITHGGLLSTFESIYHGTPILGMPVFADQLSNMGEVERQGWGKMILWNDMSEDILLQKIKTVMDNEQMQQFVQVQSSIMKDQPISPQKLVVFWTEYVIRYNGAKHLRCPIADLPWYVTYNVDVWSLVVTVLLLIIWINVKVLCAIIKCCRKSSKNKLD